MHRRHDITVAVDDKGIMYVAQGNPAAEHLPKDADFEWGLYHSQVVHRCAARTPDGWKIMTPTEARANGFEYTSFPRRFARATGSPAIVGMAG